MILLLTLVLLHSDLISYLFDLSLYRLDLRKSSRLNHTLSRVHQGKHIPIGSCQAMTQLITLSQYLIIQRGKKCLLIALLLFFQPSEF